MFLKIVIFFCFSVVFVFPEPIPNVAPVKLQTSVDSRLVDFFKSWFSPSKRYKKCVDNVEKNQHTIVTYFWPGTLVEIECLFCDKSVIGDDREKLWRYMTMGDGFGAEDGGARDTWQFYNSRSTKWIDVKTFEQRDLPKWYKKLLWPPLGAEDRPMPRFFQRDGKLKITNPGIDVQGFYHCYLETNRKVEVVQLLIAMAPLTNAPCTLIHAWSDFIGENGTENMEKGLWRYCVVDRPYWRKYRHHSLNWVYQDQVWHHRYFPVPASNLVRNLNHEYREKDGVSTYLKAQFQWTQWSECSACSPFKGWRRREGHCVIKKSVRGESIPPLPKVYYFPLRFFTGDKHEFKGFCCPILFFSEKDYSVCYDHECDNGYDQVPTPAHAIHDITKQLKLEMLNDVLEHPDSPFAQDGIRMQSAFILDFLCNRTQGILYVNATGNITRCLFDWMKFNFNNLPYYPGDKTEPKRDKAFVPCFDFRQYDDKWEKFVVGSFMSKYPDFPAFGEITGGYYVDMEPCTRNCPKLKKYFPFP